MDLYEISFSGNLVPGANLERVKGNLAKLFQADEERIALLFSGRRLVLKNNLDADAAEKYRATLERAGASAVVTPMELVIEEIEMTALPVSSAQVVPRDVYMAAFSAVDAPDYGIAQLGSDLQDAPVEPIAPLLDLSCLSVAPVGSDLGQIAPAPAAAPPDTSHLKLV